jgi:membrane-associated protease RseP (regulator of RpoE activity)|tara:strand:+ start:11 stop:1861 length:1851 start_codon:yes stop_codon:yes gene_type:complete
MAETRDIKYVAREFSDYKQELIEYAKNYFPDAYNDFSPTSPGMMFIEMAAYVGDVLSFYQDTQLQETFLQFAKQPGNLYTMAYMMGYRPKVTNAAEAEIVITQNVSANPTTNTPNWDQAITIDENSTITGNSSGNPKFFIENKIDFNFSSSYDPTDVVISQISNGLPTEFLLTKKTKAFSGTVKSLSQTFTTAKKFDTITIEDKNIIGVLEITDSSSDEITRWYEVPTLGQDSVFLDEVNVGTDADKVPNTIKLQRVPKRFVTRFNSSGNLIIQFGAGTTGNDDSVFTPNPANVGFNYDFESNSNNFPGINNLDKAYDPSNFLNTQTYGLAPSNTTLTIKYLVGGGVQANAPANTLTSFTGTTSATDTTYINTLAVNNPKAAAGGKDGDTIEEIRQNSLRSFAEQKRTITLQDYTIRALSLDPKFGTVGKVFVTQDELNSTQSTTDAIIDSNPLALSLYVLAFNNDNKLITASDTLKSNLKTYMSYYMPITDALNIKDAFVVNFGINYDILVRPNYNSRDVLLQCNLTLQDYFDISKWNINQPINVSSIYSVLDKVVGVQTVSKVEIVNKQGGDYSQYAYDIKGAMKNNIVYPSYDTMIFELKFPNRDITGRTTTL